SLPGVEVEFGTELVTVEQDDAGVTATLRRDDVLTTVRCAYIIGAAGAHSAVRTAVGIAMSGPENLGAYLAVLFRAPLAKVGADRRHGLYMVQRPGPPWVFLPTDNRDRWMFSMTSD